MPQPLQTMPCRVIGYEAAFEGLNLSETYLIAFNDICNYGKNAFSPAAHADYVGSYICGCSKYLGLLQKIQHNFFFNLRIILYIITNWTIQALQIQIRQNLWKLCNNICWFFMYFYK